MMRRYHLFFGIVLLAPVLSSAAKAQEQKAPAEAASVMAAASPKDGPRGNAARPSSASQTKASVASDVPVHSYDERMLRLEGEQRFRTNCGRCHMAPHKFPPRTMAMIVRHMRVRAMITDEDMRLILHYMTQ